MKRLTAMLALALALSLTAGVAHAAKLNKAANPNKAAKKAQKRVAGTVLKIDGMNIVVQTRGKNGGEVTVTTDASTKFQVDGKEGTLSDVKAGVNIVASPSDGTAQKVIVRTKTNKTPKAKGAKPVKPAQNA
jgi:hypothetical protein